PASAPRASAAPSATEPTDVSAEPSASASVEPSASKGEPGFGATVDRLIDAERKAAAIHRRSALTAEGLGALLWGSMAVASESIVAALKAAELAGKKPDPAGVRIDADSGRAPMPVVAIIEAEQQLVRQLHAVVYGYQLALGRLTGRRRDAAAEELTRHRLLRDRLTGRLIDRKADVPVAAAAYVPSTVPRNAATAAKLVRQLETALAPFCGLWLAAAGTGA
ncbi:MAG: ferritin-like domain-containing protein, partial [Microlunatus sp.]|nr:ferritin-like domain-containing protein [Microlunatus sp.]